MKILDTASSAVAGRLEYPDRRNGEPGENPRNTSLKKLCNGLSPDGVLLFTCGDGKEAGSVQGEFGGKRFEYSSLGVVEFI